MATELLQKGNTPRSTQTTQDTVDFYTKRTRPANAVGIATVEDALRKADPQPYDSTKDPKSADFGGRRGGSSTDPDSGISFFKK